MITSRQSRLICWPDRNVVRFVSVLLHSRTSPIFVSSSDPAGNLESVGALCNSEKWIEEQHGFLITSGGIRSAFYRLRILTDRMEVNEL